MKLTAWIGRATAFATALGILVLVAMVVTAIVAVAEKRAQRERIQTLNRSAVSMIVRGLDDDLENIRGDVLALAQPMMVDRVLAQPQPQAPERVRVERFFKALAGNRGSYAQVRLIDAQGLEVVRVDTVGGVSRAIPTGELQDKRARPYVAAINALAAGQVYVSRLDLNVEHGQVVHPIEPTLRVGTPVFADDGQRLGMVVINFDGARLLQHMHSDAALAEGSVWLVDAAGNWLIGPDHAREWRFMTPELPQAGVSTDYPAIWPLVRSSKAGQHRGRFGLLTYDRVILPSDGASSALHVIALAPRPTLAAILFDRPHLLIYLLALPILLILAGLLSHLRIRLAGAQNEIAANSRLLQDILDHSNLSMKVKGLDGRIVRANAMAGKLLGRPASELIGQRIDTVATEETAEMVRVHDREVMESGQVTTYEEQVAFLGGNYTLLTTRFPVTDQNGHVAGMGALSVDITPRIRMEEWLRLAKEDAEAANRAKATFLANMSHELRTPLNSIIGLGELLLEQAQELPEGVDTLSIESLQRVVGAGRHLLALINDILDISRVEAGHIELAPEPVLISSLVDTVLSSLRPLAEANGNALVQEVEHDPGMVQIDPMRMRQVLLNLVGNAIKFTRDGSVSVRVQRDQDDLSLAVIDTGIGMTEEQVGRIFKPFEQADRSIARRFGGTGLGLAISRQLVDLMRGEIEVASTPGQGSVFTVRLPVGPYQPADGQVAVPVDTTQLAAGVSTVLVVDDDDDALDVLRAMLERIGLEVVTARSGVEALATVRSVRPAVMLLDILLGDMSGWDVLTILRADPMHVDLPVILCTVTDRDHRVGSLGVIEHLTKPIDRDHLTGLVRRFTRVDGPSAVLVVDDDDHYREQLAMVLRRESHRVRMAADGVQALQQMRREKPELVLLDLLMPGMDGLAVIAAMRADPQLADIQVVLLTAADVPADMLRQLNDRAITLMRKGEVDLDHIAQRVRALVDRIVCAIPEDRDANA